MKESARGSAVWTAVFVAITAGLLLLHELIIGQIMGYDGVLRITGLAAVLVISALLVMLRSSLTYAVFAAVFLSLIYAVHTTRFQLGLIIAPEYFTLFFQNANDVAATFAQMLTSNRAVNLSVGALALGLIAARWMSRGRVITSRYAKWILIAVLLFIPLRIYIKGDVYDYKTKPGLHPIHAVIESGSVAGLRYVNERFLGGLEAVSFQTREIAARAESLPDNLVVGIVMGETISSSNMSLFGYERPTTPHLDARKAVEKEGRVFLSKPGLSHAPSSSATNAQFYNLSDHPFDQRFVASDSRNIFRLAKNHGFTTRYITPQVFKSFYRAFPHNIDHIAYQELNRDVFEADRDGFILHFLPDPIPQGRQFIYLYQLVNHLPFMKHCAGRDDLHIFEVRRDNADQRWRDEYDNGLRCYDENTDDILARFDALGDRPFIVVLTSDHGLLLGQYGLRGHGHLKPETLMVPMMLYTNIPDHRAVQEFKQMAGSHYELTGLIAGALGYEMSGGYDTREGIYAGGPVGPGSSRYLRVMPGNDAASVKRWRDNEGLEAGVTPE